MNEPGNNNDQPQAPSIEIIFSFDTTGSMNPVIESVRQNVTKTIDRLISEIEGIHIGLVAHGDYCDHPNFYWFLPPTRNVEKLKAFIEKDTSTGGGDAPECYEYVLRELAKYEWKASIRILVMIGDQVPHEKGYKVRAKIEGFEPTLSIHWPDEVTKLREKKVLIFSCHAQPSRYGDRDKPTSFYKYISNQTGGFYFTLEELQSFPHYMVSICLKAADGADAIKLLKEQREELEQELRRLPQNDRRRGEIDREMKEVNEALEEALHPEGASHAPAADPVPVAGEVKPPYFGEHMGKYVHSSVSSSSLTAGFVDLSTYEHFDSYSYSEDAVPTPRRVNGRRIEKEEKEDDYLSYRSPTIFGSEKAKASVERIRKQKGVKSRLESYRDETLSSERVSTKTAGFMNSLNDY